MRRKRPSSHPTAKPVSVQTGMSTKSGDELNLWHLPLRESVAANRRDVHTLSMNCNRDIDHLGSTATAEPPLFSALAETSPAPVVEKQRACQLPPQELRCGISNLLHSLHCAYQTLWHNRKDQHSVDELKLRHLEEIDEGLLELVLCDHRNVHNGHGLSPAQYLYTALGWR